MLPLPGFLNPKLQFSPKILPSEWVWFYSSQQVYVTVKPGVLPRKLLVPEGWKTVGLENPAWKGAPGCKIRAWRLQQQHKYSSQAASQIPFTQWWSSDRHKVSVFFFIPFPFMHLGIFLWDVLSAVSLAPFGVSVASIHISRQDFVQVAPGTPRGGLWRARPLKWGAVAGRNVGHFLSIPLNPSLKRTAQAGSSGYLWI